MKTFARWLFMITHYEELCAVGKVAKDKTQEPVYRLGILSTLEKLDLLA